jgi:glycine hydroxymethyltransferase
MILIGKDKENTLGVVAPKSGRTKMWSEVLDTSVFPGTQGGPLMHVIAAKAVAFEEALQPSFKEYQRQVVKNASVLASSFKEKGYKLVSDGTDNHLILIDLRSKGLTGKIAEEALDRASITVNKNMVPFDMESPFVTSGIRIGVPAMTTRGFGEEEFKQVVELIDRVLMSPTSEDTLRKVRGDVHALCNEFPLYESTSSR